MLAPCTPDSYRPLIGSDFTVIDPRFGSRIFRLEEVKTHIDDEVQLCFDLLFSCTGDLLPQLTYDVQHPQLGKFPLFLVPIRKKREGLQYEAVFNLLKDQKQ